MSRTWTVAALLAAALLAALAAFAWWWTASPAATEAELDAALSLAGAGDGRVALAQPQRAGRWLLRHPQALALAAVAAPEARPALARLQPLGRPLIEGAQGPLTVWWRGPDLAAATRMRPGALRAIALLAARYGLAYETDGDVARVATAAALLAPRAATAAAGGGPSRLAALAEVAGERWRLTAARDTLVVARGAETAIEDEPGASHLETRDASLLARTLGIPVGEAPFAARAVFGASSGWGIALFGVTLPDFLRKGIPAAAPPSADAPAVRWNGLLGEVWVRNDDERIVIATSEALVARVAPPPAGEQGRVTGSDVAWLTGELATTVERLPLLDREARELRSLGAQAAGLGAIRWRVAAAGARIELEW